MKLLEALSLRYPDSSRRTLQNWIKAGRIFLDGELITQANMQVLENQRLELGQRTVSRSFHGIEILYQDRSLIAINKPAGLLSVPSNDPGEASALQLLRAYYRTTSIFAVHRIDRETSGVLIFARGVKAAEKLDALFEAHALERCYLAIVEGHLQPESGTWRSFLKELPNYDVVESSAQDGREAITHFSVIRRSKQFTYLTVHLETGRKHQIRVHCKEAGHPVLGDKRYGSLANPAKRLCLHAHSIGLDHPFTGKRISITAPLPQPFITLGATYGSESCSSARTRRVHRSTEGNNRSIEADRD